MTLGLELGFATQGKTWFGVLITNDGLAASAFATSRQSVKTYLLERGRAVSNSSAIESSHPYATEMVRLYNGEKTDIPIKLAHSDTSKFRMRVYGLLSKIPRGQVTTYGLIAKALDSGPRALGNAVGSNPWTLFVPCHRVVPIRMAVGNYSMIDHPNEKNSSVKRGLLEREGVPFEGDTISRDALWNPR